jgi:hypothetical protein
MSVINLVLHEPIWGAYVELFGGLSETISKENSGAFRKFGTNLSISTFAVQLGQI